MAHLLRIGCTLSIVVLSTGCSGGGDDVSLSPDPTGQAIDGLVVRGIGASAAGSTSVRPSANFRSATTFAATTSGTSTQFRFYARGGTSPQRFTAHVYATNASGQPTTRLGSSSEVTVGANAPAGWVTAALPGVSILSGTRYTLAVAWGPNSGGAWVYYTPATNAGFWQQVAYPASTASWGTVSTNNESWAFALDVETGSTPPPPPPPPPPTGTTAAELYGWGTPMADRSDEFNYGSEAAPAVPNTSKWQLAGGGVGQCWPGHDNHGRRCESNTRVVGGVLRITGEADGDSGWLASRFGRKYGRWESRVRSLNTGTSNGRQYHPLLIIWPDSNQWPQGGEYDYLENQFPGAPCAEGFLHYPHSAGIPVQQEFARETNCSSALSTWHNVAFEWTANHLKGFIDGKEWFKFSGGANAQRQCIQCMPSGHQTIQLDNFYGTGMTPAIYEVDWYREYAAP